MILHRRGLIATGAAAAFSGLARHAAAQTAVQVAWVFRHMDIPWSEIDSSTVPDPGSVSLLKWAKRNPGAFFSSYHTKYLPSRPEIDRESRTRGANVDLDAIDRILLEALETSCGVDAAAKYALSKGKNLPYDSNMKNGKESCRGVEE